MMNPNCEWLRNFLVLVLVAGAVLTLTGCQPAAPPPPPDTRAADEAAIRAEESGMAQAAAAMDPARMVSFYTDDVVGLATDAAVVQGKENMRKYFEGMMAAKPEISWTPSKVEVALSGDLAYSWGTGEVVVKDAKGKDVKTTVKYVSVWKKQADGNWKIAVDSLVPDPPEKK